MIWGWAARRRAVPGKNWRRGWTHPALQLGGQGAPLGSADVGQYLPKRRSFAFHAVQHGANVAITGLAETVIFDGRANRSEMNRHSSQHAQQPGFHYRAPVGDAVLRTHAYERLNEPKTHQRA